MRGASRAAPSVRQYVNPCFLHLISQAEPVKQASFGGRFADIPALSDAAFDCPGLKNLFHAGPLAARGVIDADHELVPCGKLPSNFSAVTVRSLCDDSAEVPCWSWGNDTLTESFLGVVSVHTLVWETRMIGHVIQRALPASTVHTTTMLLVRRLRYASRLSVCTHRQERLRPPFALLRVRPRVTLWDRAPGPNARRLGSVGVLKLAPPSPALQGLASLVSEFMPAMVIHDVDVPQENLNEDYAALEFLYYTDKMRTSTPRESTILRRCALSAKMPKGPIGFFLCFGTRAPCQRESFWRDTKRVCI